tara:strand:- start:659 stop:760 length:102 start_codon:yes stop_codon:yes gene_type:complete
MYEFRDGKDLDTEAIRELEALIYEGYLRNQEVK